MLILKARALHGNIDFRGLDIAVENRRGSIRQWYDPHAGKNGMTRVRLPYGYIRGTLGADGDAFDVFVGMDREAPNAYIVHTNKAPDFTDYDEDKGFIGIRTKAEVLKLFRLHYDDHRFLRGVTTLPFEEFKAAVLQTKETGGDPVLTAKIVLDHLREKADYYTRLQQIEKAHAGGYLLKKTRR